MREDAHGRRFVDDGRPEPDTRPGPYYVSALDGPRTALVAGPFPTHAEALSWVDRARTAAGEVDPKAVWYAFGTCRIDDASYARPGVLNGYLGFQTGEVA